MKAVVIYWSGTGNTQKMAEAILEGMKEKISETRLITVSDATEKDVKDSDLIALGCPSMGAEVLEEMEMEPYIELIERHDLTGKKMALFGSYDWGGGEWMVDWQDRMQKTGCTLIGDGLIIQNTPDESGLEECRDLGRKLAE